MKGNCHVKIEMLGYCTVNFAGSFEKLCLNAPKNPLSVVQHGMYEAEEKDLIFSKKLTNVVINVSSMPINQQNNRSEHRYFFTKKSVICA